MHLEGQQNFAAAHSYGSLFFKGSTDNKTKEIQKVLEEQERNEKEERAILCRACDNKICPLSSGIEVNGRHRHTFYNPEGIIYHIGCFASAPGCIMQGRPTLQFTWFPGFSWIFALCSNCYIHLGWHYRSGGGENFYGLILNKLTEGR